MERMLMEYLVNSLWQTPVLAAGAWLVLRAGKPGPRVQHGVWVAALVLMVAMPLFSLRGMGAESVVVSATEPTAVVPEVENVEMQNAPPAVATTRDLPKAAQEPAPWLRMREVRLSAAATHRVVEMYLAVILFAMVRLLWGWMVARRMVGDAVTATLSDAESALLGACCERLRVRRPEVLVSGRTSSPLVVGVLRPVLLLPERFAEDGERDERELEAVWWHELAHVRRRDYLANLLCRVGALPVAYHPATYAVERRVRQTREMVCDRMAAEEMESTVGYARCLVGLAQRMQAGELQGTAMFGGGVLEERVTELIGTKLVESVRVRVVRAAGAAAMLAAVMGVAATFHVRPTMAQSVKASAVDSAVLPVAAAPVPTGDAVVAEPVQALRAERIAHVVDAEADRRDARAARAAIENVRRDALAGQVDGQSGADDGRPRGYRPSYKAWLDQDVAWIIRPEGLEGVPLAPAQPPAPVQEVAPVAPVAPMQPSPRPKALAQPKPGAEPMAPRAPKAPVQPDTPLAPKIRLKPLAPLPPVAPASKGTHVDGFDRELPQDLQLKLDKELAASREQLAEAQRQMKEAMEKMNTPEFRQKLMDARSTAAEINTPEFQKQRAEAQRQMKEAMEKMNAPEFRQKLMDARSAAAEINTPEFQKQRAEAQRQMKEAMEKMNTPEFKQQIEDVQKAAAKMNSAEFKEQLREAQRQVKDAIEKMNSPEVKKQMQDTWAEPKHPDSTESR